MNANRKNFKLIIVTIALAVVSIAGGCTAYYYFSQYNTLKNSPDVVAKEETENLISKVSALMELPQGEDPTIATVMDKDKIKSQPFFENTENGDKVLLYVTAKKAILYRPSTNKVVEVAPIFTDGSATTTATATE